MRFALMLNADLSKRVVLINLEFIASAKVSRERWGLRQGAARCTERIGNGCDWRAVDLTQVGRVQLTAAVPRRGAVQGQPGRHSRNQLDQIGRASCRERV